MADPIENYADTTYYFYLLPDYSLPILIWHKLLKFFNCRLVACSISKAKKPTSSSLFFVGAIAEIVLPTGKIVSNGIKPLSLLVFEAKTLIR